MLSILIRRGFVAADTAATVAGCCHTVAARDDAWPEIKLKINQMQLQRPWPGQVGLKPVAVAGQMWPLAFTHLEMPLGHCSAALHVASHFKSVAAVAVNATTTRSKTTADASATATTIAYLSVPPFRGKLRHGLDPTDSLLSFNLYLLSTFSRPPSSLTPYVTVPLSLPLPLSHFA